MKNVLPFVFLFCNAIAGCNDEEYLSAREQQVITDSVSNTLRRYFSDVRKEGLAAEFRYLDSSADFFWVPPGFSQAISYDSVTSILKNYQSFYFSIDNTWEVLKVRPITSRLCSYNGSIRSVTTDTTGKISDLTLVETGVAIKRQTGWKLLNGQTSVVKRR